MGHSERICRRCRREGLQKALDILIQAVAPRIDDAEMDCHRVIALVAERIQEEMVKNLDVQ